MSGQITYTHRRSVLESSKTIAIDGADLVLQEGEGAPRRLPLAQIGRIRLAFEPSRVQSDLFTCRIWAKGQRAPWTILHSQSFKGFADFESHDAAYDAFVRALNGRAAKESADCKFEAGASPLGWVLNIGCLSFATIALVAVLILTQGEGWSTLSDIRLMIVLGMIPMGIAWFAANKPRNYDPASIPENVMPHPE